jgi:hypothetical protein
MIPLSLHNTISRLGLCENRASGQSLAKDTKEVRVRRLTLFLLAAVSAMAQKAADREVSGVPSAYFENPVVHLGEDVLWHDPGAVETLDFRYGIGGEEMQPKPPFTFEDEDLSGSTAKVKVQDANGRHWVIKFGPEANSDTFCTRLAWALGYYVEPTYFVPEGMISGVHDLTRARGEVDGSGRFHGGRFQLRSREPRFLKTADWSWSDNPFLGTPELGGLKVLNMLVSNWDNKDSRDEARGSNTAIYQMGKLLYFFIDDWGGAMGRWGKFFTRDKWNASSFLNQSDHFVKRGSNGLEWGYVGQHSALMTKDVKPGDARWLLQYLGRVSDGQLRAALISSGASESETETYVKGLRLRIQALQNAVGATNARE